MSKAFLLLFARLLMSSLFVWDGVVQLRNPGGTARYFASVHVPAPDIAVWISIPVHLFGGLALLVSFLQPMGRCSACPCLPGHRFWRPSTGRRSEQHDPFLQEPGDDRRVPLRHRVRPRRPQSQRASRIDLRELTGRFLLSQCLTAACFAARHRHRRFHDTGPIRSSSG